VSQVDLERDTTYRRPTPYPRPLVQPTCHNHHDQCRIPLLAMTTSPHQASLSNLPRHRLVSRPPSSIHATSTQRRHRLATSLTHTMSTQLRQLRRQLQLVKLPPPCPARTPGRPQLQEGACEGGSQCFVRSTGQCISHAAHCLPHAVFGNDEGGEIPSFWTYFPQPSLGHMYDI
jgi:hypothetical protein